MSFKKVLLLFFTMCIVSVSGSAQITFLVNFERRDKSREDYLYSYYYSQQIDSSITVRDTTFVQNIRSSNSGPLLNLGIGYQFKNNIDVQFLVNFHTNKLHAIDTAWASQPISPNRYFQRDYKQKNISFQALVGKQIRHDNLLLMLQGGVHYKRAGKDIDIQRENKYSNTNEYLGSTELKTNIFDNINYVGLKVNTAFYLRVYKGLFVGMNLGYVFSFAHYTRYPNYVLTKIDPYGNEEIQKNNSDIKQQSRIYTQYFEPSLGLRYEFGKVKK